MTFLSESLFLICSACVRFWNQASRHPMGVPSLSIPGHVGLTQGEKLCHLRGAGRGWCAHPYTELRDLERGLLTAVDPGTEAQGGFQHSLFNVGQPVSCPASSANMSSSSSGWRASRTGQPSRCWSPGLGTKRPHEGSAWLSLESWLTAPARPRSVLGEAGQQVGQGRAYGWDRPPAG